MLQKKPKYNINSVNPLYLLIKELDGFIEEKEGSKYLNIALKDSNEDVLICRSLGRNQRSKRKNTF